MLKQLAAFWPLIVMTVLFYVLLVLPQQREAKNRRKMLSELKKGDRVVTIGGILGTVAEIKEDTVKLKVAEKTEIEVTKASIERLRKAGD